MYLLRQTKHLRSIRTKCSIEPMIRSLSQSDSLGARFTQIKRLFTRRGLGRLSHLSWIFTVYHRDTSGKIGSLYGNLTHDAALSFRFRRCALIQQTNYLRSLYCSIKVSSLVLSKTALARFCPLLLYSL